MDDARSILLLLRDATSIHGISEAAARRTVHDIPTRIPDIFPCRTHVHKRRTPLLRQVLWEVDVAQEFLIPRALSSASVHLTRRWISTIFSAKDNCRGNGIPPRKKSRVMSYIISGWRNASVPDHLPFAATLDCR